MLLFVFIGGSTLYFATVTRRYTNDHSSGGPSCPVWGEWVVCKSRVYGNRFPTCPQFEPGLPRLPTSSRGERFLVGLEGGRLDSPSRRVGRRGPVKTRAVGGGRVRAPLSRDSGPTLFRRVDQECLRSAPRTGEEGCGKRDSPCTSENRGPPRRA